ncbi:hypothetical protein DVH05_007489 [Phytophthora capsici]|nr:hypothetical protein DVH05_007489 [Phytophthora capsici]
MMVALGKYEEAIKDGVALFVGRADNSIGPLSQMSSLSLSFENDNSTYDDTTSLRDVLKSDHCAVSLVEQAPTQPAEIPKETEPHLVTEQKVLGTSGEPATTLDASTVSPATEQVSGTSIVHPVAEQDVLDTSTVPSVTGLINGDPHDENGRNSSTTKRDHPSSSSDSSTSFIVSKSTKGRGRPKLRKKLGKAEKRQGVARGKDTASRLV